MSSTNNDLTERFIHSLGDPCLVVSHEGVITGANDPATMLYRCDLSGLLGTHFVNLCPDSERDVVAGEIASCNGRPRSFRAMQMRDDGCLFLGEFTAKACHAPEDACVVLLVRESDKADVSAGDLPLRNLMLNHVTDGIVCHTLDGELLFANRAAMGPWGVSSLAEARSLGPFGWVSHEQRESVRELVNRMRLEGELRFESHGVAPSGHEVHLEIHSAIVESDGREIVVSSVRDIGDRMETQEAMRYLAYHDTLTGLANRLLLESELAHAVSLSDRYGDQVGVIFLDLNDFKPVNDTYGHAAGDDVLREVADRLAGAVRESDTVARPGGDEYVVLIPRLNGGEAALSKLAAKLEREIARPIDIGSTTITVTASIGTAIHEPGEDAEALLTRADLAMYQARGTATR